MSDILSGDGIHRNAKIFPDRIFKADMLFAIYQMKPAKSATLAPGVICYEML